MDDTIVPLRPGDQLPVTDEDREAINTIIGDNPTISVDDFKTYFIQMFIDGVRNAPPEVFNAWVGRFGNSTPVDIIDENGDLFAVAPPLFNSHRLRNLPIDAIIKDAFQEAEEKGRNFKKLEGPIIDRGIQVVEDVLEQDAVEYLDTQLIELLEKFGATNALTTQEYEAAQENNELEVSKSEDIQLTSPNEADDDWFD